VFAKLQEISSGVRDDFSKSRAVRMYLLFKDQISKMPNEPDHELMWKMRYEDELARFKHLDPDAEGSTN
jgi:hypothetical protein